MERKEYCNGFREYYYVCQHCSCESVSQVHLGGFQPPRLVCDKCCETVIDNSVTLSYIHESNPEPQEYKNNEPTYKKDDVQIMFNLFFTEHYDKLSNIGFTSQNIKRWVDSLI